METEPMIRKEEAMDNNTTDVQLQFILQLNDTCKTYTRFIDALLIGRPSHATFFRDLRSFRNQRTIISLLQACDASRPAFSKDQVKEKYREVTRLFLQSRWSHPWCRIAGANKDASLRSSGWWSAEWSGTGCRIEQKEREAENRLHHLLLPVWVTMRVKMFPGIEIVNGWWVEQQQRAECQRMPEDANLPQEVTVWLGKLDTQNSFQELHAHHANNPDDLAAIGVGRKMSSNPFGPQGGLPLRAVETTPNLREEFWNSAEGQETQRDLQRRESESAAAATTALRLIAAGMLLNTIPRWKLKRVLKAKQ